MLSLDEVDLASQIDFSFLTISGENVTVVAVLAVTLQPLSILIVGGRDLTFLESYCITFISV